MSKVSNQVRRPALRWHGGKWLLAPWIISHFPAHKVYVEPFGGAASVLIRKDKSISEVYNDLDGDVVNLFRVLRSDDARRLADMIAMTPFSRDEFETSYLPSEDPIERARRLVVRSFMGFGSNGHQRKTGFRCKGYRAGALPQDDWATYPASLVRIIERLGSGVVIENRPAIEVMERYDEPSALHYVDPPYVFSTRGAGRDYAHELTDGDHRELLAFLRTLSGSVILSGYANEMYDSALSDWKRVEKTSVADGAKKRVEVLWMRLNESGSALA